MRRVSSLLLAARLCCAPALALTAPQTTDVSRAQVAYDDFVARFWYGQPDTGRLYRQAYAPFSPAMTTSPLDPPLCTGCIWEYGMGVQVLYAQWKITGSGDALTRLKAEWAFLEATITPAMMSTCGVEGITTPKSGTAQDDMAWTAAMMVFLYEATGDATALAYAKAALDCAWTRWEDTETGGGLWYSDSHMAFGDVKTVPTAGSAGNPNGYGPPKKSSYQAPYALALLMYAIDAGDPSYQAKAVQLDTWASTALTVGRADGLYWEGIYYDGTAFGGGAPNQAAKASSNVFLGGNMAWAVLDAKLYGLTGATTYKDRAVKTAQGIYNVERVGGVFTDDRDAFTNGWTAYLYAANVVPLLTGVSGAADGSTILATARAVGTLGRSVDATYGGDWDGTTAVWAGQAGNEPYHLDISANAVIWPIVGRLFAQ